MEEGKSHHGVSRLQLIAGVALGTALTVGASSLIGTSLGKNDHQSKRDVALTTARRAIDRMAAEISNSGMGLSDNGIVAEDSGVTCIRVRANLNNNDSLADPNEDIRFSYQPDNLELIRVDSHSRGAQKKLVLAENIADLTLFYLTADGAEITDPAKYNTASRITIRARANLPEDGDEAATVAQLVSSAVLKNSSSSNAGLRKRD